LILGDRQTGKTAIAIDTILNQPRAECGLRLLCDWPARSRCGKSSANLDKLGAMEYTVVVVVEDNNAPGLVYITPYAATSIAEYFMEKGRDVLIVYDDLTHHARAYRELSLLLRRPPGREAFRVTSSTFIREMLERSTHLSKERGGGSLTALPIIETEAQTYPLTSDEPDLHHRRAGLTFRPHCSNLEFCRQSTLASRFRASAERRRGPHIAQSQAASNLLTRNLKNWRPRKFGTAS